MRVKRLVLALLMVSPALGYAAPLSPTTSVIEHATEGPRSGLASWYGGGEPLNTHVAMGSRFNAEAAEAAMWDIPLGSVVKVINLQNNRSIVVRITDRGPAKRFGNRVIDLTRGSFSQLAPLSQGLIPVVVQRIP